jgi:hypothetical protein
VLVSSFSIPSFPAVANDGLALGVSQFLTKVIALQWIFAFVIMAVLFVLSLAVGVPGFLGKDPFKRGEVVSEDRERAPLLADE